MLRSSSDQALLKVFHVVDNQNLEPVQRTEWLNEDSAAFHPSVLNLKLESLGILSTLILPSGEIVGPAKDVMDVRFAFEELAYCIGKFTVSICVLRCWDSFVFDSEQSEFS